MEDVDRAAAGAARCDALEKKGAGGLRLQVKYNAVYAYEVLGCGQEEFGHSLELKCVWRFSEMFPCALNYYSRRATIA